MSHVVDGSTFALLRLDGDIGVFDGSSERVSFPGGANVAAALIASCSFEAWIYCTALPGTHGSIISYGIAGGSPDSAPTNYLASLRLNSAGRLYFFWEYATGTNAVVEQPSGTAVALSTWTHVAATCSVSGGTRTVRLYINGALVHTGSDTNAAGGGDISMAWHVGGMDASATAAYFAGRILEVHVSSVARSGAEVLASFEAGRDTFQEPNGVAPTVELITPDELDLLEPDDAVTLEVTDDENAVALVLIHAKLFLDATEVAHELIHDGSSFAEGYSSSSVTPIATGYEFEIRRDAGWHHDITLIITANDVTGNTTFGAEYVFGATELFGPAVVESVSPVEDTVLSPSSSVAFDVADASAAFVFVRFFTADGEDTGLYEVAWDGTSFASAYDGSECTPTDDGFHFEVMRATGWRLVPHIVVKAVGTSGELLT